MSPLHLYRATAECSACGKVVDVGPFDAMSDAIEDKLPGWLFESGKPPAFVLSDAFGQRFALCPRCMARPLSTVLDMIKERHTPDEVK